MRYSSTDVRPESKVTQIQLKVPKSKSPYSDLDSMFLEMRERRANENFYYRLGVRAGFARGLLTGLLLGLLGAAILAVAVLGQWNEALHVPG